MPAITVEVTGDFLVEALESGGVDTSLVKRSGDVSTGVALIAVEEGTGMNTIVVDPGSNMALVTSDLDVLESSYSSYSTALFQLEIPLEVVAEGARRARDQHRPPRRLQLRGEALRRGLT